MFDHDLSGQSISTDDIFEIELGQVDEGEMIAVSFFSSAEVDVVLLTDVQYNSWNDEDYIINGSEIDSNFVFYTWTAESTDSYWIVIDNSYRI